MNGFQLNHATHGTIEVVRVTGSLDMGAFPRLENFFTTQFQQQRFAAILDCKDLNYVGSFELGGLMQFAKQSREHGGDLKLVNVPERVHHIIELLGFDKMLQIFTQEKEAFASFSQPIMSW